MKKHLTLNSPLVAALAVAAFLLTFWWCFLELEQMKDESMAPAYRTGEYLLVQKLSQTYRRGDIVVFSRGADEVGIKRVIAVPGDTLTITPGTVSVEGVSYTFGEPGKAEPKSLMLGSDQYLAIEDTSASMPQVLTPALIIGSVLFPKN
jgi:signal peptidase I